MATNEESFKGIEIGKYESGIDLSKALKKHLNENIFIVCVGTDRSTGDSVAPFVGTYLTERGYTNVIGTIDEPVHAVNLADRIKEIPGGYTVLAIDACLGKINNIGKFILKSGALQPGAGVGKVLPEVGDFHIQAVVNVSASDILNYQIISNTRLKKVIEMAKEITLGIEMAFPQQTQNLIHMHEEMIQ